MKRLSADQKRRQLIHAKKLERRRLGARRGKRRRRFSPRTPYDCPKTRDQIKIDLPAVLSLEDNYDGVMAFFQRFRYAALIEKKHIYVDFRLLRKVHSNAALMLAAELDRWRRFRGITL